MKNGRPESREAGFTLFEMLTVVFIITVFFFALVSMAENLDRREQAAACMDNMRQLGASAAMYLKDYDEYFFPNVYEEGAGAGAWRMTWMQIIAPYAGMDLGAGQEGYEKIPRDSIFGCPSQLMWDPENSVRSVSYAYNSDALWDTPWSGWGLERDFRPRLADIERPERQLLMVESWWGPSRDRRNHRFYGRAYPAAQRFLAFRHDRKANTLYADGSVMAEDQLWLYMGHPVAQYPWNTSMNNRDWVHYGRGKQEWADAHGYDPYQQEETPEGDSG